MLKKINAMAEFNRWCSIEVTMAGPNLLAANFSVNCLRPAVGQKFFARARVVKPGKMQVFTSCDSFAVDAEGEKWVANGQTLLTVIAA